MVKCNNNLLNMQFVKKNYPTNNLYKTFIIKNDFKCEQQWQSKFLWKFEVASGNFTWEVSVSNYTCSFWKSLEYIMRMKVVQTFSCAITIRIGGKLTWAVIFIKDQQVEWACFCFYLLHDILSASQASQVVGFQVKLWPCLYLVLFYIPNNNTP